MPTPTTPYAVTALTEQLPAFRGASLLTWQTRQWTAALFRGPICLLSFSGESEAEAVGKLQRKLEAYVAMRAA